MPPDTVVRITLTPEAGGVRLRLAHSGWPGGEAERRHRDSHQGGWSFFIGNLASVLEEGPDLRLGRPDFRQRVR